MPRSIAGLTDLENDDHEVYQVAGVQILRGSGAERVLVIHTVSRDEIVFVQTANGTLAFTIITDTTWRAFLDDLHVDPHATSLRRASLICR